MGDRPLSSYDLAVVGLGAMGTSVLETATRRGLRAIGFERYEPGHALGGSHGKSRMIRKAYFEDPAYVPMVLRAYELWAELERRSGQRLLTIGGVLQVGLESSPVVRGVQRSAQLHGLDVRVYESAEIRRHFPMMRPLDDEVGVFEPDGGILAPERALEVQIELARDAGGEARFGTHVSAWDADSYGVEVVLDDGARVRARALALCNGASLPELAPRYISRIRVQNKVQVWFGPQPAMFSVEHCPAFLVDREAFPEVFYGFPDLGDGLKASFHTGENTDVEAIRGTLRAWMPDANATIAATAPCHYDMSPDEHFIVGFLPGEPRAIVAGGFSGHGFKFAPVIGEIVVDLATDGGTPSEIGFLSPARFFSSQRVAPA